MDTSKLDWCGACEGPLAILTYFNGLPEKLVCEVCSTIHTVRYTKNGDGSMKANVTQGEAENSTITRPELLEKLRRLNESEADVTAQKKGEMAAFNDQLKDLKGEKKTVLEALKKTPAPEDKQ